MKTVGEQEKEFRLSKGWNTTRMGKEVGTSRQNIEHLEAKPGITPHYIVKLATAMGATVDDLLSGKYTPHQVGRKLSAQLAQFSIKRFIISAMSAQTNELPAGQKNLMHTWRPAFWEPVSGTGERLMVGVVHQFDGAIGCTRLLRDDVLDSLYGVQAATGARNLINTALEFCAVAARVGGIEVINGEIMGLHVGPMRCTQESSLNSLLRTAALLYSSLSNLDKLDEPDESDAPSAEEVNRRFSTEVREIVSKGRPDLLPNFGKGGSLIDGGQIVKFGYFSPKVVVHFGVLHPVRQAPSVRDARARLWELQRAMAISGISKAALITAVPRQDDATLGERQRTQAKANEREIEREADASKILMLPVHTAAQGAEKLVAMAD